MLSEVPFFLVFSFTWPVIEPRSSEPLPNSLLTRPIGRYIHTFFFAQNGIKCIKSNRFWVVLQMVYNVNIFYNKQESVQVSLSTPLKRPCATHVLWRKWQAGNTHTHTHIHTHVHTFIYIYKTLCKNKINKFKKYKSLREPSYFLFFHTCMFPAWFHSCL